MRDRVSALDGAWTTRVRTSCESGRQAPFRDHISVSDAPAALLRFRPDIASGPHKPVDASHRIMVVMVDREERVAATTSKPEVRAAWATVENMDNTVRPVLPTRKELTVVELKDR